MSLLKVSSIICLSMVVMACVSSSYRPTAVNPVSVHSAPVRISDKDLSINVYVYSKTAHQQAVFQARLSDVGILPILIEVRNLGTRRHKLRKSDIVLLGAGGQEKNRLSAGTVARIASVPVETVRGMHCLGPACGIANLAIAIGGIEKSAKHAAEESARFADYRSKELQEINVGPAESVQGFLYFESTPEDAGTLKISLIDLDVSKRTIFQLKL